MKELKSFLVDVPVRVNVWIRPECQRQQFEVLKQARPSTMFLISDGGRNDEEWEAIRKNRAMFDDEVDWECKIYKIYEEKNNGLYTMSRRGAELVWSKVDRCIFLEDDCVPSVSYFKYCEELLEKYKDDSRINCICSMNLAGTWENASSDYFFSETGPNSGHATWKRVYESRDFDLEYANDPYIMGLLRKRLKREKDYLKRVEGYAQNNSYGGHTPGGEFLNKLFVYTQNKLYIVPKYNMMSNVGCTENSQHSSEYKLLPRAIRKIFNMKTYEYDFPLKHPKYIIPDMDYKREEERILAVNRPIIKKLRNLEKMILFLRYKGFVGLKDKINRRDSRRKKGET